MSLREKMRHQHKSGSRVRNALHKHDGHKMAAVVNHVHSERQHGYESAKRPDGAQPEQATS